MTVSPRRRVQNVRSSRWAAVVLLLLAGPALAVTPDEMLADPHLEARARVISQELRCVVCQNQSIDDSNAPLAGDLRRLVRERLTAGDSDAETLAFVVARYGNFVLLKPPLQANTLLLWLGPLLLLALSVVAALRFVKAHAAGASADTEAAVGALDRDEEQRLQRLLEKDR